VHQVLRLYAFLAELDGPPNGPWLASFECTRADWLEHLLGPHGALHGRNYGIARLRQVMQGGTYEAAWEQSIAARTVLRHIYDAYTEELASTAGPWRLCLYHVVLDTGDAPFGGLHPGTWYALELTNVPGDGVLEVENPATGVLGAPLHWPFVRIDDLPANSGIQPPPLFAIGPPRPPYHSQATLRALHFLRAED
jgi:hypothetical protein